MSRSQPFLPPIAAIREACLLLRTRYIHDTLVAEYIAAYRGEPAAAGESSGGAADTTGGGSLGLGADIDRAEAVCEGKPAAKKRRRLASGTLSKNGTTDGAAASDAAAAVKRAARKKKPKKPKQQKS